jgi:hypothetical protein
MTLKIAEKLLFRPRQVWYWTKMLAGRSYYHRPQGLGKVFEPNKLRGYFNDLTSKTVWTGEVDGDGIPVNTLSDGRKVQLPIVLAHKALGHYDRWLIDNKVEDRTQFLALCKWFIDNQDEKGGWGTWKRLTAQDEMIYSAMTLGEVLSILLRGLQIDKILSFERTIDRAISLFTTPVEQEGVVYFEKNNVFLEEKPSYPRNTILNGWVYALFGLYDYNLVFDNDKVKDIFELTIDTLARSLPDYDSGYWSYYDTDKRLCSSFYHKLHLSQLEALILISDNHAFKKYYQRWTDFLNSFINRTRAFAIKGFQKLKEPAYVTIIK